MSTLDRVLLILHIGFAIFTLGPLTAATGATPRYIRSGDVRVLRYLHRATGLYGLLALGVFLFGLFLGRGGVFEGWLIVSMTLFVVALVLLLIIEHDQRKSIQRLEAAAAEDAVKPPDSATMTDAAQIERGRIAALSGVVALLWLVILALMVWFGGR